MVTAYCMYEFPCRNCDKTYIGETSRIFGTKLKEHKSEAEKASSKAFTGATRKASITGSQTNRQLPTMSWTLTNDVIDWKEASIKEDRFKRQIKESIWIRKKGQKTMNRDGGNYHLPNIYDQLLMRTSSSTDKSHRTDRWIIGLRKCCAVTRNCRWGMFYHYYEPFKSGPAEFRKIQEERTPASNRI